MHETPVLRLQRVPSRFFGFLVASPCLQGKLKKMTCIFRGRRNTLETSIVILRGRCRTLDVSCCEFFAELQCQGGVEWCQRANRMAGVRHRESVFFAWDAQHLVTIRRVWSAVLRGRRNLERAVWSVKCRM